MSVISEMVGGSSSALVHVANLAVIAVLTKRLGGRVELTNEDRDFGIKQVFDGLSISNLGEGHLRIEVSGG